MTTNARKTDAQRLGNGKKAFNVKQVEKMVEDAGGTEYTAGDGISISAENEISVDTTTIQEKLTAGSGIDITNDVISVIGGDFIYLDSTDWSSCLAYDIENSLMEVKKDIIVSIYFNGQCYNHYYPKGKYRLQLSIVAIYNSGNTAYAEITSMKITTTTISGKMQELAISEADGVVTISYSNTSTTFTKNASGSRTVKLYYRS